MMPGKILTTDFTEYTDFFCEDNASLGHSRGRNSSVECAVLAVRLFSSAFRFMRARGHDSQTGCIA
jgi:hypothetical protein